MFTGIVEEKAVVEKLVKKNSGVKLYLLSKKVFHDIKSGDSIAVNGACLTVVSADRGVLQFDIMAETLNTTTLAGLRERDIVNVERALKAGDMISGHFVTGHIDCVGVINSVEKKANNYKIGINIPADKMRYIAPKGSVCVDGVSLTVAERYDECFKVALIPLTLKETSLGRRRPGDKVNIECDILAKYVLGSSFYSSGAIDAAFLKQHGFF